MRRWRLAAGLMGGLGMPGLLFGLVFGLVGPLAAAPANPAAAATTPPGADPARGRLLYETGVDAGGQALQARRPGAMALRGAAVACVNCHRPSAMGGIEGGLLVPPVAGHVLFAPGRPPSVQMRMQWLRHQTRSAYDSAAFGRALQRGLDPDGQALAPEMPRYRLTPRQLADLEAYLRQRGQEAIPGLSGGQLRVATVFTPDAPAARVVAVRAVMQAWAEGQRFGPVAVAWQPWVLQGPPAGWAAQLAALQQRFPVFGLVSGAGAAEWQPVQDFCEHQRIACVMPSVDRIPDGPAPRHTVYFSRGAEGEAAMLADAWRTGPQRPARVVQVWRGAAGGAAAQRLAQALGAAGVAVSTVEWPAGARAPAPRGGGALVLWLDAPAARDWLAAQGGPVASGGPGGPGTGGGAGWSALYLSAQLAPPQYLDVPRAWRPLARWVSMRAPPVTFYGTLAMTLEPWARAAAQQGVAPVEFAEARAAAFLFADAAGLAQGVLRPDYLIERLETAVASRAAARIYVQASLGPAQRVASKGGYLLGYQPGARDALVPVSGYLRASP